LLTSSNRQKVVATPEAMEACLSVFVAMNADELSFFELIEGLERRKGKSIKISAKRFEQLMRGCGIHHFKKNDTNYYWKFDFVNALLFYPQLHSSRSHEAKCETVEAVERNVEHS
jgi:hypothetical protein